MNISPRQLRMFLALSESLNFSKTAEQLFITQPSLSKTIRDLEDALGVTLFERTTRSVQLTDSGRQLATVARTVIGEYDAGLLRMQNAAEREAQQLRIASLPSLANVMLPQVCAQLEARRNAPRITIHDCSNSASIERVLNYLVDFALASVAPSHPELQYEEILRDRFVLLSCGAWRKRIADEVKLDDLLQLPVISMTDASTAMRYISAAFLQRGVEFRPKMQLDQVGTIAGFVKEGTGVAVLPYLGMMPMVSLKGMKISSITDGPLRSVGVVTRRQSSLSTIADEAIAEVRGVATQLREMHAEWLLPPRI
ncbi:LysR family transcriptional regulator [Diaphorobacter sp. HDW4A]|uniref:LysR family transcriptional regulator n=1 Tax=Diaphorobacter sp. HDW4A TaxID=2714924 RepID=UPI00140DD037|nr:LysR family transcriptional regulator [Diaphorobacter sp. HDW4A]QIL78645.1 LysR family transcriptional regulator [Diaphorobacter sp. HDW4A]